jgi:glycine/D-amino acid oxidase-like deaminating enzyme
MLHEDHQLSYWAATAAGASPCAPLQESRRVDVAIVGAGFTGLSTALHLAGRGVECAVLDAFQPGWGASGRNGGQVVPLLKHDPSELVSMFGPEAGERLARLAGESADFVFDLVAREKIECDLTRSGWMQLAHSRPALETIVRRAHDWESRGVRVEVLDKEATRSRVGGGDYLGAWVDPRGGLLHPLKYARGLAVAAARAGAAVFGDSPVARVQRDGDAWSVVTAAGAAVRAGKVLLATNAYTGQLWPGLDRTVLPANSLIVATEPLPAEKLVRIVPRREGISTTHRLVIYFRVTSDGRLLLGGRGQFRGEIRDGDFGHLMATCRELYGDLGRFEYKWGGKVAITRDFLPRVRELAPGLIACVGYNGRGVALASRMGASLAGYLAGTEDSLPFENLPFKSFPFPKLRKLYLFGAFALYGAIDRGASVLRAQRTGTPS